MTYKDKLIDIYKVSKIRIVGIIKLKKKPKVQILECNTNTKFASEIVSDAYNAIRFNRGEDLTREELDRLIFKDNYYSFTSDTDVVGEVTITTSESVKVKEVIKNVFS